MNLSILNRLKDYFDNSPSLFLLLCPYILITYPSIKDSEMFSVFYFLLAIALILIADALLGMVYKRSAKNKKPLYSVHLVYSIIFIFFYGDFFLSGLTSIFFQHGFFLRAKATVGVMFLLFFLIVAFIKNVYSFFNRSIIFLVFILLGYRGFALFNKMKGGSSGISAKRTLTIRHNSDKPIMLIILDEYASQSIFGKSVVADNKPNLGRYLDSTGWNTIKNSYSANLSTIISISSIFNGNLSNGYNYDNSSMVKVVDDLKNASVIKNLAKRNVILKNYSPFTITDHPYYIFLYRFPDSFSDLLMMNSLYLNIKVRVANFNTETVKLDHYSESDYNQKIYDIMVNTLNTPGVSRQLIYVHLLMPHYPYHFGNEIALDGYTIDNYYQYWLFTNKKIIDALKKAKYLNNYRIIISGDHGLRGTANINPHQTFTAFYGFDKADVDQLRSVQDIGNLIDGSFK